MGRCVKIHKLYQMKSFSIFIYRDIHILETALTQRSANKNTKKIVDINAVPLLYVISGNILL